MTLGTTGHEKWLSKVVADILLIIESKGNEMTNKFARKLRARRDRSEFNRALNSASPSMQQELLAAASRQSMH